jgi:hypothetical protein
MKRKRKDPLIIFGDERRLVRHWATVYNIKEVWVGAIGNGSLYIVLYDTSDGAFRISINRPLAVDVERAYTIKQLCGEEENEV